MKRRLATLLFTLGALCFCAPSVGVNAQSPHRFKNPFFDALREIHSETPDREILEVLMHEEVRSEINLKESTWKELESVFDSARAGLSELHRENEKSPLSKVELKAKLRDGIAKVTSKVFQLLDEQKVDMDRLLGIYFQVHGFRAAATDRVANRIGLSGDDLNAFREQKTLKWQSVMDSSRDKIRRSVRGPGQGEMIFKILKDAREEFDNALKDLLNEDQQQAMEKLRGEEFEFAKKIREARPGGFRPGGRGRPGGGRGDTGDRNGNGNGHKDGPKRHSGSKRDD